MRTIEIISRSTSLAERSVIYKVDGAIKRKTAPALGSSFESLESQIYAEENATENTQETDKTTTSKTQPKTAKKQ